MQDIVIPQINGDMSHPFDTRIVLPVLVGEKQTIAPSDIRFCHVLALFHLRARGGIEQGFVALVECVLHEGGAIEFLRGEPLQEVPLAIVQANGAVDVGHAEELITLLHDLLHVFVLRLFQSENAGVFGVNIGDFIPIIGLVPTARFADYRVHGTLCRASEHRILRACARAQIDAVART